MCSGRGGGALTEAWKNVMRMKDIVAKGREGGKDVSRELCAFYVSLIGVKKHKLMPGEWLERKLSFIHTHSKGSKMDMVVSAIKECMRDVYPNIPIFPTEKGYSSLVSGSAVSASAQEEVEEEGQEVPVDKAAMEGFDYDEHVAARKEGYSIRSKMIDGKRWFYCPFERCEKKFRSQRTADSCLNAHLGLLYKCRKCEFVSHNYDSSRNHKCFASGRGGSKRKSSGEVTATRVKQERREEEEDVIVLE